MSAKRGHASMSSQKVNQSLANTKSTIGNRHTFRDYRGSKSIMAVSSFSRKGTEEERHHRPMKTNNVRVLDENGVDVTPRSLLSSGALSTLKRNQSLVQAAGLMDSASVTGLPDVFGQSFYDASMIQSSFAPGFTRSINGSTAGSVSRMSFDSVTDESIVDHHVVHYSPVGKFSEANQLTVGELESTIEISLDETDTIWHFDMPGTSLSKDNEDANRVMDNNKRYEQVLENRPGNDMYVHSEMQTFNNERKTKGTQASQPQMKDVGCLATTWDMYDSFAAQLLPKDETNGINAKQAFDVISHGNASSITKESRPFSALTASRASLMTSSDTTTEDGTSRNDQEEAITEKILNSQLMRDSLFTIERAVMQNVFHEKQASYRGYSVISEDEPKEKIDADLGACLERLWIHACPSTKGKSVNCFAWNKSNKDILAAGYGMFGTRVKDTGTVCCWSVKNPETPERRFSLPSPVMSLDFSVMRPNLLAVGLYDGTIVVFDVRLIGDIPCLDTRENIGKHCGPVWQLQWVCKGSNDDKDELLVSVSADGRVTQWAIRKGFEHIDLMKLKRTNETQQSKSSASKSDKKNEALISRYAQATCISFHPKDNNIYLVGSEDGHLHKCSCSYNEQSLETYGGHVGCVYKVSWSPFVDNVFLSCSSDWSARLWHQDERKSIFELKSTTKRNSVVDCDWSPMSSTVFTSIDECCLEVWDLNINTLDPLLSFTPVHENKLTAVSFSRTSPSIFVGDEDGNISVYILRHCEASLANKGDVLIKSMTATQHHNTHADQETSTHQQSNIDIKQT